MHEQEARVRQPGQRIGQRVFLRLLEQHRVVDDRGRLFRDAVEQPTMIVAIERGVDVVDRQRADEAFAEEQRAHQRRLQVGLEIGQPGGLEVRARPRVDQRAAIARDPARQALPRCGPQSAG